MTPENFVLEASLMTFAFFVSLLIFQQLGRIIGRQHDRIEPDLGKGTGVAEGAVFGMLGLFLAFTFSGAGARFDERRHLIVDEVNAIGTAWLRIDVLPQAERQPLRELFRNYLDQRIETYAKVPDMKAVDAANARAMALQGRIWTYSVAAAESSGQIPPYTVLLPALNEMFDITTTRTAVTLIHPPLVVFGVLIALALVGALFAGYGMATRERWSLLHSVGYAVVIAGAMFVIINFEFPRVGLIRIDAADQFLLDLRKTIG